MQRGDYDYNHASTGTLILIVVILIISACLGGLTLGLTVLS